jgi:hypothetical protein
MLKTLSTSALLLVTAPYVALASPNILFVVDSSNSMWGQVGGIAKIDTAKTVLSQLASDIPSDASVGLMGYGHREPGQCDDIELIQPVVTGGQAGLAAAVGQLSPKGKTPIAASLLAGGKAISSIEGSKSIVLISDGVETCDGNPCEVAASLANGGVDVRVHVVGFDLTTEEREALNCIASKGNGQYFDASSTEGFAEAVQEAVKVAAKTTVTDVPVEIVPEILWEEDFDDYDLLDPWVIDNPNPENYVVDGGELIHIGQNSNSWRSKEPSNLFVRDDEVPRGNWDMSVDFKAEYKTFADVMRFGVRKDSENYIVATLSNANYNDGWTGCYLKLGIHKRVGGEITSFTTMVSSNCDETYNPAINALETNGATLTLSKRGRDFSASFEIPSLELKAYTQKVKVLRVPGYVALGAGYWGEGDHENAFYYDRIEMVRVSE